MKLNVAYIAVCLRDVAPFAGAWIEIKVQGRSTLAKLSLPSRERGLKSTDAKTALAAALSLPSRERGLKYTNRNMVLSKR